MAVYSFSYDDLGNDEYCRSLQLDELHVYGSSRHAVHKPQATLYKECFELISPTYDSEGFLTGGSFLEIPGGEDNTENSYEYTITRGKKYYEISNHLGNVLSTIYDKKLPQQSSGTITHFLPDVSTWQDYLPFGMLMYHRHGDDGGGYRYGFSGGEKINEISGEGNYVDIGERGIDVRLGRLNWRVDPDFAKYPYSSPYTYAANNPIRYIDIDGRGPGDVVVVFAGADLFNDGGLGSAQGIVDYVKKNDFNQNGGYAKAFASKYWGVAMKSTKDLDVATQAAYEAIKANHNVHNGEKVEGGKVLVYGYSWGGVLAQHLTDRLKADGIQVELLITVDAAAGKQSNQVDRTVSDNVKENLNIYQTTPSFLKSYGGENTADDSDKTNVTNSNYTGRYTGTPGQDDFQKVEHSTIDEISQPRVNQKIISTVKRDGQ